MGFGHFAFAKLAQNPYKKYMLTVLYYNFTKMSNVFLHFFRFYLLFFTNKRFLVIFPHKDLVVKLTKSPKISLSEQKSGTALAVPDRYFIS